MLLCALILYNYLYLISPSTQYYNYCFMQLSFKYNWRRWLQTKSTFILSILFIYIVTLTGVVNISTHRFYLLTSVLLFQPGRLPSVFLIGYVFEKGIISVRLSDNALISPSFFKNSFAIYRILDWHYFCLDPNLLVPWS